MVKEWEITVSQRTHKVVYSVEDKRSKGKLFVDDQLVEIQNSFWTNYIGIDIPITLGDEEFRFVSIGKQSDIVKDGFFISNKDIRYKSLKKISWWAFLFLLLLILIPIISIGGALPTALAALGVIWCLRISLNPFIKVPKRILYNFLVVLLAWLLFGLLLFGLS